MEEVIRDDLSFLDLLGLVHIVEVGGLLCLAMWLFCLCKFGKVLSFFFGGQRGSGNVCWWMYVGEEWKEHC